MDPDPRPGSWSLKGWTVKNLDHEQHMKQLDEEKREECHIVQFINTEWRDLQASHLEK